MVYQADTIIYDTLKIAKYQADSHYDYSAQLDMPEYSWFEQIQRLLFRFLNKIFSGNFEEKYTIPVIIILFIVIVAVVLAFLYKKRPELFMRSKKTSSMPYDIEEENIHGINFEKEIDAALEKSNYRLAIRLKYLQTLRYLSDNKLIDWQIHKTPTEYLYELRNHDMKPSFRELTNHFLQVRYGNYDASLGLFETMNGLQTSIRQIGEGRQL